MPPGDENVKHLLVQNFINRQIPLEQPPDSLVKKTTLVPQQVPRWNFQIFSPRLLTFIVETELYHLLPPPRVIQGIGGEGTPGESLQPS